MIWRGILLLLTLLLLGITGCIAVARTRDHQPAQIWTVHEIDPDGSYTIHAIRLYLVPGGQSAWRAVSSHPMWLWFVLSVGWTAYATMLLRRVWIRRLHVA